MSSSLQTFLSEQRWAPRFDDHILALGKKAARPRTLSDFHMEFLGDGGCLLTAAVAGDPPGEVEVSLWPEGEEEWGFDTTCSCSFGCYCFHAAAVLMAAAQPSRYRRPPLPKPGDLPRQDREPPAGPGPGEAERPRFALHLTVEPATSKITRLLLQALRLPPRPTWLVARPTVRYGDHRLPLTKSPATPPEAAPAIPRDKAAEFRALETLTQLGLTHLAAQPSFRFLLAMAQKKTGGDGLPPEAAAWFPEPYQTTPGQYWPWFRATAVPKLRDQGWEIEIDEDFGHPLYAVEAEDLETTLTESPGGWFSLSVGFEVDGESLDLLPILVGLLEDDTLAQLTDLPETARHLVYLPNGGALHLPVPRLRKILQHLSALVDPNHPKLHPLDAARLIADSGLPLDTPPRLKTLRERLSAPSSPRPPSEVAPPETLQATLRPYQAAGYQWMSQLADHGLHGILADDMGLGKTVQTLALLLRFRQAGGPGGAPSLVVAPTSVVPNWRAEAKRFAPSLKILVLTGPRRRALYATLPHADLVLTSYAILQRDSAELKKHRFHHVILDEAQHIKNPAAKVSQAACALQARHRLCLSGTPVENNLGELWSLMRFLIPGFLGPLEAFRARFQHPIEKEEDEDCRQTLQTRLAPLILRRTKDEVAKDLPPKTPLIHPIELSTTQKDLYETVRATMDKRVREAIAARGLAQSKITILDALLKLRQICCDPRLLNDDTFAAPPSGFRMAHSAKLSYFLDLLDTLLQEKRRILLFSQFTTMLALIEEQLGRLKVPFLKLTGSSRDRGRLVEEFQGSDIPLFLISLKAGGTGLNLTGADTVIHYDPWWNPAAENQATDRAYRIGQDKPVVVHKLLCANTVEDRIHQLQQKKAHLADSLLAEARGGLQDEEALRNLLAPLA